jgi:hypothetical protein
MRSSKERKTIAQDPREPRTAEEFLHTVETRARRGLRRSLKNVRSETLGALDGNLARRRPLLAVALTTAGGAATGFALVRILRSPQRALRLVVKTLALAGAVLFAIGLADTLTAWLEPRPCLGKLAAGALLLAAAFTWHAVRRAAAERALIEKHRRKYAELERTEDDRAGAAHGGRVPSPGGNAGASGTATEPEERAE